MARFAPGERVYYILPKGPGRPKAVYLPATVIRYTPHRMVIKVDGFERVRVVSVFSCTPMEGTHGQP